MDTGKLCFVNMQYVYVVHPNVLIQNKQKKLLYIIREIDIKIHFITAHHEAPQT